MTYTSDIPLSGESLGSTRDRIRTNFQQIATINAINHVAFNASGQGKHKFLQMPEQTSAPTTLANEGGLYTKEADGTTQLFYRQENDGAEIQITNATSLEGVPTVLKGSVMLAANNTTFVNVVAVPANTYGTIWLYQQDNDRTGFGDFVSNENTCYQRVWQRNNDGVQAIKVETSSGSLFIRAAPNTAALQSQAIQYIVNYFSI